MEDYKVEFLGEPCGQHGPYTFYRAIRYRISRQTWATLGLGQFFNIRIAMKSEESTWWLSAIGELQLLWFDRNHEGLRLASVRLYMLPEDLPSGRLACHGQDEVIADDGKFVLRVDDLLHWVFAAEEPPSPSVASLSDRAATTTSLSLSGSSSSQDCNCVGTAETHRNGSKHVNSKVTILSFPQYCRYRSLCKRLENFSSSEISTRTLLAAIGGNMFCMSSDSCQETNGIKVLFCRDTIIHEQLQQHTFRLEHLAPVLKGRKRKKKTAVKQVESEDSNESETSSERNSLALDSACTTPSKAFVSDNDDIPSVKPAKVSQTKLDSNGDEEKFLKRLFGYMKKDNTSVSRLPTLGCKEVDLFLLFKCVQSFGGYKSVVTKRLWKQVYNLLGGSTRHTGAATGTRKNYERFLLAYEKRLKNYMKKKNKPNGVHKLAQLGSANGADSVSMPQNCKPIKAGRLVIRLPLKFKMSTEKKSSTDESPSSDSDDKPLSVALPRSRKTVKSSKKTTEQRNGEESTDLHDDTKKNKVKKPKSDKRFKCNLKSKPGVENASLNGIVKMPAETVMMEVVDASIDLPTMPSVSGIKREPAHVKTSGLIVEKSDQSNTSPHETVIIKSLSDNQGYVTESKHTELVDVKNETAISHPSIDATPPNILVANRETYHIHQSAAGATSGNSSLSVIPELVSSGCCHRGNAEVIDGDCDGVRRPVKSEVQSISNVKDVSSFSKTDDGKVISSHAIDTHSQLHSVVNESLSNILNVPFIPYANKRQSPEKFMPTMARPSNSNVNGAAASHNMSTSSSPSAIVDSCSRSSSFTQTTRIPYANCKPDQAMGRSEHPHMIEQSSQDVVNAKRQCLEQRNISGSADYGSTSTIVSPIKQFVDRARNRAISSSLQSKCISTVDSGIISMPARDSVLRYSSTERPQQATANQPLDLSTKKPKLVDNGLLASRPMPTISANIVQDEPLDLSKPLPRLVNTNRARAHRPESSNHRISGQVSEVFTTSASLIRSSSSHRSPVDSLHRSSAEPHSSVVFSTSSPRPSSQFVMTSRPMSVTSHTASNQHRMSLPLIPTLPPSGMFPFIPQPPPSFGSRVLPNGISLPLYDLPTSLPRTGLPLDPSPPSSFVPPFLQYLYSAGGRLN